MLASTTTPASSAHALQKMLQIRKKKEAPKRGTHTAHTLLPYSRNFYPTHVLCVRWDLYDMYMYIVPVPYLSHEAVCRVGYVATLT